MVTVTESTGAPLIFTVSFGMRPRISSASLAAFVRAAADRGVSCGATGIRTTPRYASRASTSLPSAW